MASDEENKMTLEEMGKYRATAQQKSMEAIHAVEQRYNEAKKSADDDKMIAEKTVGQSIREEEIKQIPETAGATTGVKVVLPPPKQSGNESATGILGTVIGIAQSAKDLLTGR